MVVQKLRWDNSYMVRKLFNYRWGWIIFIIHSLVSTWFYTHTCLPRLEGRRQEVLTCCQKVRFGLHVCFHSFKCTWSNWFFSEPSDVTFTPLCWQKSRVLRMIGPTWSPKKVTNARLCVCVCVCMRLIWFSHMYVPAMCAYVCVRVWLRVCVCAFHLL